MRSVATHHVLTERGNLPVISTDAPQRGADARSGLPWVVFVPSIFGVAPDLRVQMAELGDHAQVLAVDPFHHVGAGPLPYTDFAQAVARLQQTDLPGFDAELVALLTLSRPRRRSSRWASASGAPSWCAPLAQASWRAWSPGTAAASRRSWMPCAAMAERGVPARLHFGDADAFVPRAPWTPVRAALGRPGQRERGGAPGRGPRLQPPQRAQVSGGGRARGPERGAGPDQVVYSALTFTYS
jgi:hypothetical protein